jgi:hypothetical protein
MCGFVALTIIVSIGLFSAAVLVPAPRAVLPLVLAVCIGGPMLAAWELRGSVGTLHRLRRHGGARPLDSRSLAELRRHLEGLPETQHPLGL